MKRAPKDVDAYIAAAPPGARSRLRELRQAIRRAAPAAVERISYGMPYYEYRGRLVYFSLWKKHIGVYAFTAAVLREHRDGVRAYATAKGTLRFPLDQPLPLALIRKLIRSQMKHNESQTRHSGMK